MIIKEFEDHFINCFIQIKKEFFIPDWINIVFNCMGFEMLIFSIFNHKKRIKFSN